MSVSFAAAAPAPRAASKARVPVELLRERAPSHAALAKAGYANADELAEAIAAQFSLPRLPLDSVELAIDLPNYVSRELAVRHGIIPVFASDVELSIAVSDPSQLALFDWLSHQVRRSVTTVIATPGEIERAHARLYEARRAAAMEGGDEAPTQADLAEATQAVNAIVAGALEQKASDIHVEAGEHETVVRYRVDGALRQVAVHPRELHAALVSRLKVLAALDISIHHAPQDGRIKLPSAAGDVDLRVSVLPTYWGEKVVCRLLDNKRAALPLEALGFDAVHRTELLKMVQSPYGLVLVTGPTGSGKSTTLYAALNAVTTPDVNIVTVEDPVEYQIPGINQVQVAPRRGLTFATALRSILRQDPDVILVGEIRDQETGQLAAEAALTGHLVLSSLHTNDAASSITRLCELGVEPFLVAPSLLGIVAQRLVRTVCSACKEDYVPDASELVALGLPSVPAHTRVVRGRGCSACHRTGLAGRVAVREVLVIDDDMRAMITRRAPTEEIRAAALAKGFRSMRFAALRLWLGGAVTTREVIRVTRS